MIGGRYSVAICMPDRRGTRSDRWKMEAGTLHDGWWLFMRGRKFQARWSMYVHLYGTVQAMATKSPYHTVLYVPYSIVSGL